jgi:hypothetical protein
VARSVRLELETPTDHLASALTSGWSIGARPSRQALRCSREPRVLPVRRVFGLLRHKPPAVRPGQVRSLAWALGLAWDSGTPGQPLLRVS